jgi:hypothetical protein
VVFVSEGNGAGIEETGRANQVVTYYGKAVVVNAEANSK